MKTWIRKHQLLSFFVLAYALAYGAGFGFIALNPATPLPTWSPFWFVFVFSPTISSILIAWVLGGWPEVRRLLAGLARWKVSWVWYLAAAFLILGPLCVALVYGLLGNPVAGLLPGVTLPMLLGQMFFQFFSGPASEETGWRGFALPRLQTQHSALVSSLILGVIWTCWHLPLFFLTGQAQIGIPFPFYLALVVTQTVYLTWLYNNTRGSLVITILCHFAFDLTGTLITGMVSLMPTMLFYMTASPLLLVAVILVVLTFGPRYLSKKPLAELPFQPAAPAD